MRRSRDVIQKLLDEMQLISSYHPKVGRTEKTVDKLIDGTAFFPGGTGLWRGENRHGPVPEYFPLQELGVLSQLKNPASGRLMNWESGVLHVSGFAAANFSSLQLKYARLARSHQH